MGAAMGVMMGATMGDNHILRIQGGTSRTEIFPDQMVRSLQRIGSRLQQEVQVAEIERPIQQRQAENEMVQGQGVPGQLLVNFDYARSATNL